MIMVAKNIKLIFKYLSNLLRKHIHTLHNYIEINSAKNFILNKKAQGFLPTLILTSNHEAFLLPTKTKSLTNTSVMYFFTPSLSS